MIRAGTMQVEQRLWKRETGWQRPLEPSALAGAAQLVLVFGCAELVRGSECLERAASCYPRAHVVGCTTAGQIHDARVTDETITLTAVGNCVVWQRRDFFKSGVLNPDVDGVGNIDILI